MEVFRKQTKTKKQLVFYDHHDELISNKAILDDLCKNIYSIN